MKQVVARKNLAVDLKAEADLGQPNLFATLELNKKSPADLRGFTVIRNLVSSA